MTAGLLSGCGAGLSPATESRLDRLPPLEVSGVPVLAQEALQCGPASLATVLTWGGSPTRPAELTPQIYSPTREGTLQPMLIAAARHYGHGAFELRGMDALLTELTAGHPVLVLENLGLGWMPRWHYSVVVGMDPERRIIRLHSGRPKPVEVTLPRFLRTWERSGSWGLLVLPPGVLPESLPELETLAGLAALERAGRREEAGKGYAAALRRWPDSLEATIGLGNVRFSQGDPTGAAEVLMEACRRHPASGVAWNNLAHALLGAGRLQDALAAALRAVDLGGPMEVTFRETLAEVRAAVTP